MTTIAQLPRHQQALLFTVLQSYKNLCETEIAKAIIHGQNSMIKELAHFSLQQSNELIAALFGEAEIKEMEFIEHFARQYPQFQFQAIDTCKE